MKDNQTIASVDVTPGGHDILVSRKMTGDQLVEARGRLGMTQVEFGALIGRYHTTIARYEAGVDDIPAHIALLVNLIERVGAQEIER